MAGPELIDLSEEEFHKQLRFSNQSDNGKDNIKRAKLLGFENEITVSPGAIIRLSKEGVIGSKSHIGLYAYVNGNVCIGSRVLIGPYCSITAGNHKFDVKTLSFQGGHSLKPIKIGDGSWLAASVTITAGVTLGKANLVCANSVVTKDTEDFKILAGVPAKVVGEIDPKRGLYRWYKKEEK